MNQSLTLADRAQRCIATAATGQPVMLICSPAELEQARELVNGADVIVATPAEATAFLAYMRKPAKRR